MSLLSSSVLAVLLATSVSPAWQLEVDPWVFEQTREGAQTEFLVVLDKQADLSAAESLPRLERRRFVFETLRATAAASQGPVLAMLADRGLEHRSYWISNMIWVRGSLADVEALAQREDVAKISANPWVKADLPDAPDPQLGACPPPATEASLLHIDADVFWDAGFEGEGVVIGGQDTGYDWDHPALRDSYRGWNGAAADHNYHWWDAIHSGGGSCGADSTEPCDDGSHGTHTMGTMVGDDGTRRVGMAPKAKWIGCRNMNQGFGTPTTYAECFQFFIAPTDLSGQNPDPSMGPDVINNSWGCPGFEGCTDPNVLRTVVENTRAAGIVVVVSAGNGGSGCGSVNTPAAIYDASFSVGNTNLSDNISFSSSRGPVTIDGSNRLKPDVSAPGTSICSTTPNGNYSTFSGTSMAGPHVAGLVALILDAAPNMSVDEVEAHIRDTVVPRTSTQTCGGVPGSTVPNNTFGYGVVRGVLPPLSVFTDSFESGDTTAWSSTVQ